MRLALIWDTETTGKLHKDHRIIELSIRLFDIETQKQIAEYLWRFNPERNIDAKAFAVHGITRDELKEQPLIKEKLPDILKLLKAAEVIVHHNGDFFDIPFLKMECERNGIEFPDDLKTHDTMLTGSYATDLGKSPSLLELCWALNVDYDKEKAHKGDYDTLVLAECFFNAINEGWISL